MLDRLPLALVELCMARLEVHIMLRCARVCRLTKQALSGNKSAADCVRFRERLMV